MALARISGWPEEPDSPVHSFGGVGAGDGGWGRRPALALVSYRGAGEAVRPTGIGGSTRSGCARTRVGRAQPQQRRQRQAGERT